jgi:hypothetical protein
VGKNFLRIEDVVTFKFEDQQFTKLKDDYAGAFKPDPQGEEHSSGMGFAPDGQQATPPGLQVRIAATHSGIITRNNGFYLPDRMKKGASSFTDGYEKPCLIHHQEEADPVGRIIASGYIDTSGSIEDKYNLQQGLVVRDSRGKERGVITDTLLRDFVNGRMSFGMQIDTVCSLFRDSLLEDSSFEGLGHIQIVANITNQDAIEKLLDRRYLTGSVGATTNKAVCSVCRQDWTEEGKCEHRPGAIYDGAKCFIIAGDLLYDEFSWVNVPADRHSKVLQLHYNGIQDSIEIAKQGRIYEVRLGFPQFDSDPKEDNMSEKKKDTATEVAEEPAVDIKDKKDPVTPESAETEDQGGTADVQDSQTDEAQTGDESVADAASEEEDKKEDKVEDPDGELITRVLDSESDDLSEEEQDKLYDALWAEAEAGFEDGEFTLEELEVEKLEDAKLSSEKRKKLAKSTFCGPKRSFPVPDCAHVTAARRLIGRYKGPGNKSTILACVSRKAKAMGCGGSSKKKDTAAPEVKEDAFEHGRVMHMVIAALEEAQHYSKEPVLDDGEVKNLQMILKRLAVMVGKDAFTKAAVEEELALDPQCEETLVDEIVKSEETVGNLRDELAALRSEYHALYKDLETVQDAIADEKVKTRKAKESQVTVLRTLKDAKEDEEASCTKLTDADLDSELTRLTDEVDMAKIVGKLGDGMSREPAESVEDPTVIQDENQKSATPAELEAIQAQHLHLKFTRGDAVADAFVKRMQQEGKLPQDS